MKKILVIADEEHKNGFSYFFEKAGFDPCYISDVTTYNPPYKPENVRRYVQEKGRDYQGAFVCGCCADSLEFVLDKEMFPGKVVFLDIGGIGMADVPTEKMHEMGKIVDLYITGTHFASELSPELKKVFA